MSKKKWKVYVVPHTHWDKEWFFTKEDCEVVLDANIKHYTKFYENNRDLFSFTYDGQSSIIDDYFLINDVTNSHSMLETLNRKKLIVGPWYIQPDFFNTTSESLVRNLLIGINTANRYHADYLRLAYVPDSFGQNEQMPQIYKQFALDYLIYWRGIHPSDMKKSSAVWWEGIDGSKVMTYNLRYGYWPMGTLYPYDTISKTNVKQKAKSFYKKFQNQFKEIKRLANFSNNTMLVPLGGDQAPIMKYLSEFIHELNKIDSKHEWILSTYDHFTRNINTKEERLDVIKGNLISPAFSRIHRTISSQRVDIKQLCKLIEYNIFRKLEPLSTYFSGIGGDYKPEVIQYILKKLITCQAHDSLGGCVTDKTNNDIKNRLIQVNDLVNSLTTRCMKMISETLKLKNEEFIIFNPEVNEQQNNGHYEITLFTKHEKFDLVNIETGAKLNFDCWRRESYDPSYFNYRVFIRKPRLPLFSINRFKIVPSETNHQLQPASSVDNKRWRITVNIDGTLDIFDKKFNKLYKNTLEIYVEHDCGDSYDFSPSKEHPGQINKIFESKYTLSSCDEYHSIKLHNVYEIPSAHNGEKIKQAVDLNIQITDNDIISLIIQLDNKVKDARWLIKAHADFLSKDIYCNHAFCTSKHPVDDEHDKLIWKKQKWPEYPANIWTNESYAYIENSRYRTGFLTSGENNVEARNEKDHTAIYLTLFRSVGFLGKRDLVYRPGRASGIDEFEMETPEAQLLTNLSFKLAWFTNKKDANLWNIATNFNTRTTYYQRQHYNKLYRVLDKFFMPLFVKLNSKKKIKLPLIDNNDFSITCIKKMEYSDDLIIRGFNNSEKPIKLTFTDTNKRPVNVDVLNLKEKMIKQNIKVDIVNKYEIRTYRITTSLEEGHD